MRTRTYTLTDEQREKVRGRCRLLGLSLEGKKLDLSEEQRKKLADETRARFTGEKNSKWKGGEAGYRSLHNWVENRSGKPRNCTKCGNQKLKHRQYHWANISGKYLRELSDWMRLCVKCHIAYDL